MNRYDRRRWFGELPRLPEDAWQRDTDRLLSELKNNRSEQQKGGSGIAEILGFAFTFTRLDSLSDFLSPEDWGEDSVAILNRGHLRFYRAMAENPDSPDSGILSESASDYKEAANDPACAYEALAGLTRLMALEGGIPKGLVSLARLERSRGRAARRAAVGARLFMAELPGTGDSTWRRHLKKAEKHLRRSGTDGDDPILRAEIGLRLGNRTLAMNNLATLSDRGSNEAEITLLTELVHGNTEPRSNLDTGLLERIQGYKDRCTFDPRSFMLEGELLLESRPEEARMAWRGALVMDDRHAPAWSRLGDLYREAWERDGDDHRETWLEAASDAYVKAASLVPLEGRYRVSLGQVEREAGRPGKSISSLTAAVALTRNDRVARRLLALAWTDLAYSPDFSPEGRSSAAGRAKAEWMRLLERGHRDLFDVIGLCRSVVLEAKGSDSLIKRARPMVESTLAELERGIGRDLADEIIPLAEDFISSGFTDRVPVLLACAETYLAGHPRILALQASLAALENPLDSIPLYLEATEATDNDSPEYAEWVHQAAEMASVSGDRAQTIRILKKGLTAVPDNRVLLRDLATALSDGGSEVEALAAYRRGLESSALDEDLLEDVIWFARERGLLAEAREFLEKALKVNPDNGRIWNQLGVLVMETSWEKTPAGSESGITSGALDEAIQAYRKAVNTEPENIVFQSNLGDALRQAGQWSEAADLLEESVGDGSVEYGLSEAFALNSLARLKDERSYSVAGADTSADDWESAGELYRMAVEATGDNTDFLRDYAWWLFRERRLEEAALAYQEAAALDPGDESFPYGESSCWRELGDEQKAMDSLDRALAIQPDDPVMIADKAELIGLLGHQDAAGRLFDRVLAITDDAPWVEERLARYYEQSVGALLVESSLSIIDGDGSISFLSATPFSRPVTSSTLKLQLHRALDAWRKVLESKPGDRSALNRIGVVLMALGESREAREILASSLGSSPGSGPENADTMNRLGRLDMDFALASSNPDKHLESARRFLRTAAESAPAIATYHADLAYCYAVGRDWSKACECFAEASERDGEEASYAAYAGIAAYLSSQVERAVSHLQRALVLQIEAEWQNVLGLALLASGSPGSAIEAFRSACLTDPVSNVYPANLEMAYSGLHAPEGPLQ